MHDPIREEFVNVGILFYVPELNLIKFSSRDNTSLLKNVFPDIKLNHLRHYLKSLEDSFNHLAKQLKARENGFQFDSWDIKKIATQVLPVDASSTQWGKSGSGITDDYKKTFDYLNERFVQQKLSKKTSHTRTDEKVWGKFSKELSNQKLLDYFIPRVIEIGEFEEMYKHTYKNGKIHCLKPISFDMADKDEIKDKCFKETGKIDLAQTHGADVVFYCLLGKPQNANLLDDYEKAKRTLEERGGKVFVEDKPSELPQYLEKHITFHK